MARNVGGRLASRHFRNQLWYIDSLPDIFPTGWNEYLDACRKWASEISLEGPEIRQAEKGFELDVFYNEGRGPREVEWAGDGLQVWLQLLLHLQRLRTYESIVLDEPEVFLHPDLQRRLVHLLERQESQSILATHSPEIAAEVADESLALMDRSRQEAIYPAAGKTATDSDFGLGTGVNFALAKSLRAKLTLFVEGKDLSILRRLASTCGAFRLASETSVSVVKLGGIDNRSNLQGFGWLVDSVLGGSLRGLVILDRDYRMPSLLEAMKIDLKSAGLNVHIWHRKELESYLVDPEALARIAESPVELIHSALDARASQLKNYVAAQYVDVRQRNRAQGENLSVAAQEALSYVDERWASADERAAMCPPKKLLAAVNDALQGAGYKALSPPRIAADLLMEEIPPEAQGLMLRIEELIS